MDLLYFQMAKKLGKKGGQPYLSFLKHQIHVLPGELIKEQSEKARKLVGEGTTFAEIHQEFFDKIPFELMWVETHEPFQLTNHLVVQAFSIREMEENKDYALWMLTNAGDFKLYIRKNEGDMLSAGIIDWEGDSLKYADDQELAPMLTSYVLYAIAAITHREYQYGTAKHSRLIRGSVKPFDVTYIRHRRKIYTTSGGGGEREPQNVTWHHSWRVCGCWVKIKGIGKNRQGQRVVKGLTWRIPHVKGTGPLKEKLRVMATPKESSEIEEKDLQVAAQIDSGV